MSTSTKFMLATAGILFLGAMGYFVAPALLANVGRSQPAPDMQTLHAGASISAVPTTAHLPPLDEPAPSATSSQARTLAIAALIGAGAHAASGTVMAISIGSSTYIRYVGIETQNGPDLHVFLSKDLNAGGDSIDLGPIKTTSGSVNYEVPASVAIERYPYVLMWSGTYGVLFNYAKIQ